MSAISEIENLKCNSFVEAKKVSFPVVDETQSLIGTLVPIGEWIFDYKDIIEQICNWRQKAMRYFLSQFESTITRTESYLRELSIQDQGRVLFLIFSTDELLVGHIGIKDVDGRSGGVDNAMRGRSGGHPKLIFFSERRTSSFDLDNFYSFSNCCYRRCSTVNSPCKNS